MRANASWMGKDTSMDDRDIQDEVLRTLSKRQSSIVNKLPDFQVKLRKRKPQFVNDDGPHTNLVQTNTDNYLMNTQLRGSGSKGFQKQYVLNRKHPTLVELFKSSKGNKSSKLEDVSSKCRISAIIFVLYDNLENKGRNDQDEADEGEPKSCY